jgi:hypothetical protein
VSRWKPSPRCAMAERVRMSGAEALFVRLLKTAGLRDDGCREDFFTECLAATLSANPSFAVRFAERITGWSALAEVGIAEVATQLRYPGSQVDLVLTLGDGRRIGVEHKLYSPEGKGQLDKYLALDVFDAVAFVTAYASDISDQVLADSRYVRPGGLQPHFLWSDFYDLVAAEGGEEVLRPALRCLFDHLNFQPPVAAVGDLESPDAEVRQREVANFMKLYAALAASLRDRGWRHELARPPRFDRIGPEGSPVTLLAVEPADRGSSLRLRLYMPDAALRDALLASFAALMEPAASVRIRPVTAQAQPSRRHVIDVRISLSDLFAGATDASAMMIAIQRFVEQYLDVVPTVVSSLARVDGCVS